MSTNDVRDDTASIFGQRIQTAEEITAAFQEEVRELGAYPMELAERLHKLGDYRPFETTLRGIQRMLSGETRVSGEMKALVTMMLRQRRRLQRQHANLIWTRLPGDNYSTVADGFRISLSPQTRGRWHISVVHVESGYSHPWPRWQESLEAAKLMALTTVEDATDFLIEHELNEEKARRYRS